MQRREVLASVKLVPKVSCFVLFRSYDGIRYYPGEELRQYRYRLYKGWHHTYLTSFGEFVIPTLMVDAPLSMTMTGGRLMIGLDELYAIQGRTNRHDIT